MGCLCQEIAGLDIELSSTGLGQLWMFENLAQSEMKELSHAATRKKMAKGDVVFLQSAPADNLGAYPRMAFYPNSSLLTENNARR